MPRSRRGGYRRPRNPNRVSGPGKYSQRTDGGVVDAMNRNPGEQRTMSNGPSRRRPQIMELADAKYGEQQSFHDAQAAAPMGGAPLDTSGIVPLTAPTMRPDEPVTSGSALGPGRGPEALGYNPSAPVMDAVTRARMESWLPVLMFQASRPDASPETRQFIRQLRGDLL